MTSEIPFRSLKRNLFFSAASALLGIVYPVVTMAYVARVLGPEALGKYYFANSLAVYFLFIAGMGIPVYGIREVGRARGNPEALRRVFSELFTINFVSNILIAAVFWVVILAVPDLRAEGRLFGALSVLFLGAAFNCDFLFAGLERQDLLAYRSLASKTLGLVLILILVHGPGDYVRLAAIVALAALVNVALGWIGLKYWAGWRSIRVASLARHIRPIILIAVSSLFINIYTNLDTVLLGFLSNPHQVGLYGAVMRPCRLMVLMVATLAGAALPRLTYYIHSGEHGLALGDLQKKSLELLMLVSVPACAVLLAAPEPVTRIVYGAGFLEAASSFRVAGLLLIVNGLTGFYVYQVLLPMGREKALVAAAVAASAASVALNLVLIPRMGHVGAVWAAVAAESVALVVMAWAARRIRGGVPGFSRELWKYPVAGVALAGVLLLHPPETSFPSLAPVGLAAMLAYVLVLLVLREPFSRRLVVAVLARASGR